MKPIDKKDLPKLIAIVVACVCVLGWLGYTLLFPQGTATPPATAASAATGATPAAGTTAVASTGTVPAPGAPNPLAPAIAPFSTGKDPFVPNGPAAEKDDPKQPPRVAGNFPRLPRGGTLPPPRIPSWLENTVKDVRKQMGGQPSGGIVLPEPVPPPPAPNYTMTGVVMGDGSNGGSKQDNVAILRGGEKADEHRFVRVGDKVDRGYVVTAIGPRGIELRESGGHRVTIALGKKGG